MLYRTLQPGKPRPANVVRLRVPIKDCTDCQRPNAGYRCRNAACSVSIMLLEVDSTTLPHPRTPHQLPAERAPRVAHQVRLVSYYDVVELVAMERR
jgi:hypothetical protein